MKIRLWREVQVGTDENGESIYSGPLFDEIERLRGALEDACSEVHGWFGGTQEGYDITEKIIKALEVNRA